MDTSYYTIGMAGHIDHGKTTLTKALTNVDTDRLKAEKERNISIELGFAPLNMEDDTHVSIVDVPGHERFIRQMIAGVAGIDLVVMVIAADEGVMPQTREHLEILAFLGIEHCIIVMSKIDQVETELIELVEEDIKEELNGTTFQHSPFMYVDSISGKGIDQLKETIVAQLKSVKNRNEEGAFRLPIDQVFTVQGQGTIVRGTIYEGIIHKGDQLTILPKGLKSKARQLQVHHEAVHQARAGQRTAVNLSGVNKEDIKRGDVLVDSDHFLRSNTIDVSLKFVENLAAPLKQRAPVRIYVGTSEVTGTIIFFDRNEVKDGGEEVLCQIRLEEDVVIRRDDRFIIRRPTPVETLGGGWIIEPNGGKYRFGENTIKALQKKKEGTPEDLIQNVLTEHKLLDKSQLIKLTSVDESEMNSLLESGIENDSIMKTSSNKFVLAKVFSKVKDQITSELTIYHETFPMRLGMDKAELLQTISQRYPKSLIDFCINTFIDKEMLKKSGPFMALSSFHPHLPREWENRMNQQIAALKRDGITPKKWSEYADESGLSQEIAHELKAYLIHAEQAYQLTDDLVIHHIPFQDAVNKLETETNESFKLTDAKETLGLSRKYLIPFLELLDAFHLTTRKDDVRLWRTKK